ncbi:unnamed protein product [Urochloa decumbens]|uniref:Uncharacterized protein n=1 Tax=Urochloa decumbens TaxID=240449 RepID=A0ABC9GNJ8_9POAL
MISLNYKESTIPSMIPMKMAMNNNRYAGERMDRTVGERRYACASIPSNSEEFGSGEAAVEEVVRDVVPGLSGAVGAHGVLRHRLVVGELAAESWIHLLPAGLADVVQHAAGSQHHGEVLQLHLGALLQARPPALEPREGVDGDAPQLSDLLVEGVLRPRQVGLRVGGEHPVREREAGAADDPGPRHHACRGALLQRGSVEHLVVGHGARPSDADVGEGAVGADDPLQRDGIGGLVVALRVAAVEVGGDRDLGRDDGDVGGVDDADDARDPRFRLEPGLERVGGGCVGPAEEARHEEVPDGGADLEDELVAGGDAEAEALGDEAERLPRGEAPDADGDPLADGDGGAERGVLLGDGGAQRVAEHGEGGAAHPEGGAEVGLRVVGAAALLPPRARPVLHP